MILDPCCDTEPKYPTVILGEDRTLNVQLVTLLKPNGINITGVTEIDIMLLNADDSCLHKLLTTGGVVVVDATTAMLQLLLTGIESALLKPSTYDDKGNPIPVGIEVHYTIAGKTTYVNIPKAFYLVPRLFPNC